MFTFLFLSPCTKCINMKHTPLEWLTFRTLVTFPEYFSLLLTGFNVFFPPSFFFNFCLSLPLLTLLTLSESINRGLTSVQAKANVWATCCRKLEALRRCEDGAGAEALLQVQVASEPEQRGRRKTQSSVCICVNGQVGVHYLMWQCALQIRCNNPYF